MSHPRQKIWRLLTMTTKAPFYRLRHDLGRETVVMVSCVIFIGTFFYVFEDFLNVQIASLSKPLREWIAWGLLGLLTAGLSGSVGWRLGTQARDFRGIASMALFLGENPQLVKTYGRLWATFVLVTFTGALGLISHRWLIQMDPLRFLILSFAATFIVIMTRFLSIVYSSKSLQEKSIEPNATLRTKKPSHINKINILSTLTQYRINQLFARNSFRAWTLRLAQVLLAIVGPLCYCLTHSLFLAAMGSLLTSFLLVSIFAGFVAEDIAQSWTERGLGVTHRMYISSLERLTFHLLWLPGILLFLFLFLAQTSFGVPVLSFEQALLGSIQVGALSLLPLLSFPWTALQIDARKPSIPIMTSAILGLFIGSAILAHPLAIGLIPLLRAVALPYQEGRFYRAA